MLQYPKHIRRLSGLNEKNMVYNVYFTKPANPYVVSIPMYLYNIVSLAGATTNDADRYFLGAGSTRQRVSEIYASLNPRRRGVTRETTHVPTRWPATPMPQ